LAWGAPTAAEFHINLKLVVDATYRLHSAAELRRWA
jgi:hypothetical protein